MVIRDKRYIINELKSDITSGEVSLGLINDFRPMINSVIQVNVPTTGGTISYPVSVPVATTSIGISSIYPGVTISTATVTTDTWTNITAPTNPNPMTPIVTESGTDSWISDEGFGIINEDYSTQVIPIDFTYNNNDGSTYINTLNLSQV